ncbi:MAG: hypothetical protein HZA02_08860 [Nitrospinae bacterium]|nr:hypothetical protein [Nitrospinota bacterium]
MSRTPATFEQAQEAHEFLKSGLTRHEAKNYTEAIADFKKCASVNPFDPANLEILRKKVAEGGLKLVQESVVYMGCAAVHFNKLMRELSDEDQERLEIDQNLKKAFETWD